MRSMLRITLKLVLAGLILLIVAALTVLLPAHWQTRQFEPQLPTANELRTLLIQPGGPSRIRYLNTSEQKSAAGTLTHSAFLVEWANGTRLMIDTGMTAATARSFGKILERLLGAEPAIVHGTVATLLGNEVKDVAAVAYTHLHSDHTDATLELCGAHGSEMLLLQTPWQAEQHNFTTRGGAERVRKSCLRPTPLQGGVIQSSERFPGLGIVALGGHTPDSTLFAVPVGGKLYLLSGDITNSKAEIAHDVPKAWLYSYLIVPEHVPRSSMLRQWLAGLNAQPDMRVVVSHDLADIRDSGMESIGPR